MADTTQTFTKQNVSLQDWRRDVARFERSLRRKPGAEQHLKTLKKNGADVATCIDRLFLTVEFWSWDWRKTVKENRSLVLRVEERLQEARSLYSRVVADRRCSPVYWDFVGRSNFEFSNVDGAVSLVDAQFDEALVARIEEMRRRAKQLTRALRASYRQYRHHQIFKLLDYVHSETHEHHYSELADIMQSAFEVAAESGIICPPGKMPRDFPTPGSLKKLDQRRRAEKRNRKLVALSSLSARTTARTT